MIRSATDLSKRTFTRVLLVKPSSLGDVVHALPVLNGLRNRFPHAKIGWLIGTAFAPLLEGHPQIDELIRFDRRRFGRLGRSPGATLAFGQFVKALRQGRYDLAIDLQGLFRSGFLTWASGAGVRIGVADAREGGKFFYTHRIQAPDPDTHAVDRYMGIAEILGFDQLPVEFPLPEFAQAQVSLERKLSQCKLTDNVRTVVIAPGARWETKRWSASGFAAVVNHLQSDAAVRCVLVGGASERSLTDELAEQCRVPPINLAGETNLGELVVLLKQADLILCHDSAVAHLAVALDRPLVCLTGPTNPLRTGPYHRLGDVVRLDIECAPCYLRRLSQCPHSHRCMSDLDVRTVVDAINRRLEATDDPKASTVSL